jgi:hypothetical protein
MEGVYCKNSKMNFLATRVFPQQKFACKHTCTNQPTTATTYAFCNHSKDPDASSLKKTKLF